MLFPNSRGVKAADKTRLFSSCLPALYPGYLPSDFSEMFYFLNCPSYVFSELSALSACLLSELSEYAGFARAERGGGGGE